MSLALILVLCFFQNPAAGQPDRDLHSDNYYWERLEFQRLGNVATTNPAKKTEEREAHFEEQEFANRFNKLMKSLLEFADAYNNEHSMDVRKIKQIKKAWHDLEMNEPWFKPQ